MMAEETVRVGKKCSFDAVFKLTVAAYAEKSSNRGEAKTFLWTRKVYKSGREIRPVY